MALPAALPYSVNVAPVLVRLDRATVTKLLATGRTDLLDKFVSSKTGRSFSAYLVITDEMMPGVASLAFGGVDRRTAYLGCLLGDAIAWFRAPVAGEPPVHWDVR